MQHLAHNHSQTHSPKLPPLVGTDSGQRIPPGSSDEPVHVGLCKSIISLPRSPCVPHHEGLTRIGNCHMWLFRWLARSVICSMKLFHQLREDQKKPTLPWTTGIKLWVCARKAGMARLWPRRELPPQMTPWP